jgi:D-arabinose 1-dehydrogenase-like Zn-dependent alcohol dehydrogenase
VVTILPCGATSGDAPPEELTRVFFLQLRIIGSTMGNRDELQRLAKFCVTADLHPVIDSELPMKDAKAGFQRLIDGDVFGKVVLRP